MARGTEKKKKADETGQLMRVECAHTELRDIDALTPHPRNPNKHPPAQIELLAKILVFQGFRSPIVVSKRSGYVIKGHGRLEAARKAGFQQVPVDLQDYANEAAEHADMIADNRIAELSERDNSQIADLIQELDAQNFDLDLSGFDDAALESLMTSAPPEMQPEDKADDKPACTCPNCGCVINK